MKKIIQLILFFLIILFLSGCSSTKYVSSSDLTPNLSKSFNTLSIDDCNKIINFYSLSNNRKNILSVMDKKPQVVINALPLNKNVILALSRKEAIEKRLNKQEYLERLKDLLESYTSFTIDTVSMKIVPSDSIFTAGYSFKLYLENQTEPYHPIFLEDGYSYFFLENMKGKFSRIIEVTGLYAEDYIQLDGYLNVVITFSPFATDGTKLFKNKDLDQDYKLVFNGLQDESITLTWKKLD